MLRLIFSPQIIKFILKKCTLSVLAKKYFYLNGFKKN
jgi:hypothetical protein